MKTIAIINFDNGDNDLCYVEEKEIHKATIQNWLDADFSKHDAGLEEVGENEDGETLYRSHAGDFEGEYTLEEIQDVETDWYCISYWDGNNWNYDIFETYDTEEVEIINRSNLEPSPLYYYVYELIFEDGTKIIATRSNQSGSISSYYEEDNELLEMFEIKEAEKRLMKEIYEKE